MAVSPESMAEKPLDFRAPPPSPIASGRRSSFTNDDILSEFLEHSVRVPDLVLPDKVFPKQRFIENPPTIDFLALDSKESEAASRLLEAIATIGCFQLVNHGIPEEAVRATMAAASAAIFGVAPEKRAAMTRSSENHYGFEEAHGEEESEEFLWCNDEKFKSELEGISPPGYSNFREMMEELTADAEKMGEKLVKTMREKHGGRVKLGGEGNRVWYVKKHKCRNWEEGSLRNEAIRMLIRGFDHSHALCLHLCEGSSEFHVYSKKGWVSFSPLSHALLVTVGDQIQAWSGGKYKQVVGRAVYREERGEDCISMAFLYSDAESRRRHQKKKKEKKEKTISLGQQLHFALFLTLVFRFLLYLYGD